jgi:hypothetical protein
VFDIDFELNELDKECEKLMDLSENLDLFDDLEILLVGITHKIKLLDEFHHPQIREQYVIDLFLTQSISIYEGFVHNLLLIIDNYRKIIDIKENNKKLHINNLLKKTLNNPSIVKETLENLLDINFDGFVLFEDKSFSIAMKRAVEVRNAHIHRNSIHEEVVFSLEEATRIHSNLTKFISFVILELSSIQRKKHLPLS